MTPAEAAGAVGRAVLYRPRGERSDDRVEQGVITSVNERWAFVRYGADVGSRATDPADLTPLATR